MKAKTKICNGCGQEKYIWKNIKGKKYCKFCSMNQQAMTKTASKKTYKPIAARSVKKSKEETIYALKRKIFLNSKTLCKAKLLRVCTVFATDVHHKAGRVGKNFLDESTWLPVCRQCHMWIEEHPIESKEKGFSISRIN
jgi:hypothetical protein